MMNCEGCFYSKFTDSKECKSCKGNNYKTVMEVDADAFAKYMKSAFSYMKDNNLSRYDTFFYGTDGKIIHVTLSRL